MRCDDFPDIPVGPGWLAPLLTRAGRVPTSPSTWSRRRSATRSVDLNRRLRDFSAHRMLEVERGALGDVHVDIGLDVGNRASRAPRAQPRTPAASLGDRDRARRLASTSCARAATRLRARIRIGADRRRGHAFPAHGSAGQHAAALRSTRCVAASSSIRPRRQRASRGSRPGCSDPDGYRLGAAIALGAAGARRALRHRSPSRTRTSRCSRRPATARASRSARSCSRPRSRA